MLIQCTKKLLDELKVKPQFHEEEEPLFSWHANFMTLNRRKTIVMVNDQNRYVIVLHGLKAKDFSNLDTIIWQGIRETLLEECVKEEIIEQYLNHSPKITYTKTKDRTSVARMNKACEMVSFYEDLLSTHSFVQSTLSMRVSRNMFGQGKNHYIYPNEELYKDLETFSGQPIFSSKALELMVTLKLEKHHVWRRLVVPANRTYNQLHKILQAAFGWKDYHLHEFYLYDSNISQHELSFNHSGSHEKGYKPILNLICDMEAFEYETDIAMQMDSEVQLLEYPTAKIKYNYDFGDNWQHYIEVVNVLPDFEYRYPICIEGEGNTPPEDVGGEYGYEEFLAILADPAHPDHGDTVTWAKGQGFNEFDLSTVNMLLKLL